MAGTIVATDAGAPEFRAVVIGAVNAVGSDAFTDILRNKLPFILLDHFYASYAPHGSFTDGSVTETSSIMNLAVGRCAGVTISTLTVVPASEKICRLPSGSGGSMTRVGTATFDGQEVFASVPQTRVHFTGQSAAQRSQSGRKRRFGRTKPRRPTRQRRPRSRRNHPNRPCRSPT